MPTAALKNALQARLDLLQQLWERRDSTAIVRESVSYTHLTLPTKA